MISIETMREARRALVDEMAGNCPDAERLYDAATGALPPAEVAAVVDHVGGCGACAADWALVVAARQDPARNGVGLGHPVGRYLAPILGLVALAAGAALMMKPPPEPVFRDGTPREQPLPEQKLSRDAFTLRWAAGTGTYTVLVSDEAGRPLHREVGLRTPEVTVPAAALEGIAAGATVVWQVEETLPDGSIRRSAVHRSVVR